MNDKESMQVSGSEGVAPSELDYIPLFLDFYDRYSKLSYEEWGRLVWAMLAYARGEDPDLHLTDELDRYCFSNEREMIDRTAKVHVERKERRKAASQVANAAKYNHSDSDRIGTNRSESDRIGVNRSESEHNNNNNNNYNNNNNNNHNNNNKGGMTSVHGANRRSAAGKPAPVGREKIL